jgi:arylsulfatase
MAERPNILLVMTDQQRFDTIAALGNSLVRTPNLDRLAARGVAFTNAYTTCPVCEPARYTIRTGLEPLSTGCCGNGEYLFPKATRTIEERCGPFLARTMASRGYRTFGIGKFHAVPWDQDLGYEVHLHSEELYGSPSHRGRDAYAGFIAREHPEHDWIEMLQGERTEMYYVPQMSPLPAALTVESWAADRAVEQLGSKDPRPFFGLVSFIGPHPPFAPPLPYNRLYDPDRMPEPVRGDPEIDGADEQIAWMNYAIWAEDIGPALARILKARYYGEITYIDACLGRILDAAEARPDAENTLICFFADHGDHLGDHGAWQKESFFEAACHVPFLLSWPRRLPAGARREELVCLADLFGMCTAASGEPELRDGADLLGMLSGSAAPRERVVGIYGVPGTRLFKIMVRAGDWKYIFMANGGREQLFDVRRNPGETRNLVRSEPETARRLRAEAVRALEGGGREALRDGDLLAMPFEARPLRRIYQFSADRGVRGFGG